MTTLLSGITSAQLRRAVTIKEKIEALDRELQGLLGSNGTAGSLLRASHKRERMMSADGKAKIAAAQRKRWAKWRREHAKA
jgi:hypothetical protein